MNKTKSESLRILHLVRSLNVGGLEKVVVDLTHGLSERDIVSYLGCLIEKGVWWEDAEVADVWCGELDSQGVMWTFIDLYRYVKKNKIDIIHTHNSHPHKYGALVSLVTGVPMIHTKHGRNWPDNPKWVWLSRQLSRLTKYIVTVSKEIEQIVIDIEKVSARKVVTILNGVGAENNGADMESARTHGQEFVIGSVGRFSPEKCYPLLVRAFAKFAVGADSISTQISDSMPARSVKLILVGDGAERGGIESEIKHCGIEDYVLLPGMRDDVREWLKQMDIFCLSSDQEGTSVTLLEAGAVGVPAVVTDVGGNAEIVENGVTGIVVPSGDEQALCDAFYKLYAGETHISLEKMGIAARARIEKYYSLDAMIDKYVDLYLKMARRGRFHIFPDNKK